MSRPWNIRHRLGYFGNTISVPTNGGGEYTVVKIERLNAYSPPEKSGPLEIVVKKKKGRKRKNKFSLLL